MISCVKPAGVPAQSDKSNDEDMVTVIKNYLYDKGDTDEEPYVAPIHRLDRPVGGVMIFAKTPEAAASLSGQVTDGAMVKFYQAIVTWELPDEAGELTDYLVRDPKTNTSKVADKGDKGAKKAVLSYEVLDVFETDEGVLSYILIELQTGRHHQIRVQMSHAGMCLLGDYKYADERTKKLSAALDQKQVALCAYRLDLIHPATGKRMSFRKEPQGLIFQNFSKQISDKIS